MSTEELNASMPTRQEDQTKIALVDVGGYKLAITCQGEGFPTVILEAGWGDSFAIWGSVIGEVAQFTRVGAYDRASLGHSEQRPAHLKPSAQQTVRELHTLLVRAGIASPYILVGHSIGGLYMQLYASLWPDEVAGVVLVDSSHQHARGPMSATFTKEQLAKLYELDPLSAEGGMTMTQAFSSVAETRFHGHLPNVPLLVLSRGLPAAPPPEELWPASLGWPAVEQERAWASLQLDLVKLSPQGRQIIAQQSGHYIQIDQPKLVVDGIREVIEAIQHRHYGTG